MLAIGFPVSIVCTLTKQKAFDSTKNLGHKSAKYVHFCKDSLRLYKHANCLLLFVKFAKNIHPLKSEIGTLSLYTVKGSKQWNGNIVSLRG